MNLNKKLEELKPYQLNCNVFDVYSYNGLSMQDLLCQFFTKINECITVSNGTLDLANWLVNEGLEIEVVKKLMIWLEDGTLENIINVNLFNTLNEKINDVKSKLETKSNKIQHNIEDFKLENEEFYDNAFERCIDSINGGEIILKEGNYVITKPIFINKSGVKIKGLGYKTRLIADKTFVGDSVILFKTNTNEMCKGNGLSEIFIDCNGVNADGLTVYGAYDMSIWSNFEVRNVNRHRDCVKFLSNAQSSTQISQTIKLENIIAMHDSINMTQEQINTENAQGRCFTFENVQEMTINNCKGFGLDILKGCGISFEFKGCRGISLINNSYCFNRVGIKIDSTNRSCNGIFISNSTIEELTEMFIMTSGSLKSENVNIDNIRVQNSIKKITLDHVNNSIINSGLCDVEITNTCSNITVFSMNYNLITNNGVRCSVVGYSNNINRGLKISNIDFNDVYNDSLRIFNLNNSPGVNAVGVMVYVNTEGVKSLKQVYIGSENSGGEGYRVLRILN